ncbi:MAG: beta-N-acetylhexosaminidase [Clostridia bacterium]|nr:beta-N-acetylhexosaminidase [Clostridia bacterium]NCC42376.1 beta-N-acetylhexosaminidase [Clostridia bacterium]
MQYTLTGSSCDIARIDKGTAILFQEIHPCSSIDQLEIQVTFTDIDTLSVAKQGAKIQIQCRETTHYFRGLTWALHHLREDSASKVEHVYLRKNGMMLDCSRNAVYTVTKVKSMIRTLAKLGMNDLLLYTEDTYEVPEEPYFGTYRGRYSQEEIRQIDSYAQIFGIELIPCIQTLAHLRNALKWPLGTDILDTNDILMVGNEKAYTFIEELLSSVKASFSTRRVHLGMDEAEQLGLGKYLKKNGYTKSADLIKEHCQKVINICKKLDLEPMIWSDMCITSNTGESYYAPHSLEDADTWVKPDKNLGLVYWDYYNVDKSIYENMLKVHGKLSTNIIFAGGAWIWNGISPNYSKAFRCTLTAFSACHEYGISEAFCTAWTDNGTETPVDAVYPGLVLFAHMGFHRELSQEDFVEEFENVIGGKLDDFYQLDAFDSLFVGMGNNTSTDNPSKYLLYQDALLGMFDHHVKDIDTASYYSHLAEKLELCQKTSPAYKELFRFYQLLALVLSQKADLGIRIKNAYDAKDLSTLSLICEEVIPSITENLWEMKLQREQLWLRDAKPFGYELLDIKLGGVITRLESNRRRILSYLEGNISALEELEQVRLPYFTCKTTLHHDPEESLSENRWHRIVSGCEIIDTI